MLLNLTHPLLRSIRMSNVDNANAMQKRGKHRRRLSQAFGSGMYPRMLPSLGGGSFGGEPGVDIVVLWLVASLKAGASQNDIFPSDEETLVRAM